MITHDLTNADGSPDRFKWLREENKLRRLQEDIRNLRLNIGTALGILTSTMTTKIHMQLQELQLITERGQALTIQNLSNSAFQHKIRRTQWPNIVNEQMMASRKWSIISKAF